MTPVERNPMWTAYPDPVPEEPVRKGHRVRRVPLLGVPTVAGALVLGLSAGSAYAYLNAHGAGNGKATVGTLTVAVVASAGTPSSTLFPNGTADLTLTLNSNASGTITGITQNGTLSVSGGSGGCSASNSGVSVPTNNTLSVSVAAGSGVVVHIPNAASMSSSSNNGCQGATFSIPVTITVQEG